VSAATDRRNGHGGARAWIGLGSNLGDRRATLEAAIDDLRAEDGVEVLAVSPWYETAPVGPVEQGAFLNGAAGLRTDLPPGPLLALLSSIERRHGRDRTAGERWGPRTLDLDLLLYEDRIIDEPGLTVPHPRMAERRFVLEPLAAIAPNVVVPAAGGAAVTVGGLLERLEPGAGRH